MPIKKLKSLLKSQEDQNWKDMEVNYTPEDRQNTLSELESILSRYDDISDNQKHKIINKFSEVMGGENIYEIDPRRKDEISSVLGSSTLFSLKSDIRREIFNDYQGNKYINYNNGQKIYGYIEDVLGVSSTNSLDISSDKDTSLIDKIKSKLSWVKKIGTQFISTHIQEYINTLDDDTKQRVAEHVEYTPDSINFKVKINGQDMIVPFEYHNATKSKDIIQDGKEQVVTKEVELDGQKIKETYFRWNRLDTTYGLIEKTQHKPDALYIDTLDDDLRYIPTDNLYEQLLKAMPAGDYERRGGRCISGKQLAGLLGVQLTGYLYDGGKSNIGLYGYLWSASVTSDVDSRGLGCDEYRGALVNFYRSSLRPFRSLRTST